MNSLKRLSITVSSQINSIINQIENHEAVANSALHDIHDALLNAKFQIRRVQNEQKVFTARLHELQGESQRWSERALQSEKEGQHERALECVSRLQRAKQDIAHLQTQLQEHGKIEIQLNEDVQKIEAQFEDMKRKRSLLMARESRSHAAHVVNEQQNSLNDGNIFDRWEQQIMKQEVRSHPEVDSVEREFQNHEERQDLESLLAALKAEQNTKS